MANRLGMIDAAAPEAWDGPAIEGFAPAFADPDVERRYRQAGEPHNRRLLGIAVAAGLLLGLLSLGADFVSLPAGAGGLWALWPDLVVVGVCAGCGLAVHWVRGPDTAEGLGVAFGVLYAVARCMLLALLPDDSGDAALVGSVVLLYFALPVRLWLLAPLLAMASGGMIAAWSARDPAPATAAILQVCFWLWLVNLLGLMVIRGARLALRRQWAEAQALRHANTHDQLTGVANRCLFERTLVREWSCSQGSGDRLSVVLVNVDHFHLVNDCLGYEAGDGALRRVAAAIGSCLPGPGEMLARTDGDGFACLLPKMGAQGARLVAEHAMAAVRGASIAHPCAPDGPYVTVSVGVATASPTQGNSAWELTALAERLLHSAKEDGRNRMRQHTLGAAQVRTGVLDFELAPNLEARAFSVLTESGDSGAV
jgi:diguanylate cyclase (GGDEF)-like protein